MVCHIRAEVYNIAHTYYIVLQKIQTTNNKPQLFNLVQEKRERRHEIRLPK